LALAIAMVAPAAGLAAGGARPDLNPPDSWNKVQQWLTDRTKLESRVRDTAVELHRLRTEVDQANPEKAWYGLGQSEREKIEERQSVGEEKLKDLLASTPSALTTAVRKLLPGEKVGEVERSNVEILEVGRALVNRSRALAQLKDELQKFQTKAAASPHDLDVVVEYYTVYAEVTRALHEMCQDFAEGADGKYGDRIRELIARSHQRMEELRQARSEEPRENREAYDRLLANTVKLKPALERALVFLDAQKDWAKARLVRLAADRRLAEESLKTAELSRDVRAAIEAIATDFKAINEPLPPLISFELNTESLGLPVTSPAGDNRRPQTRN
jgi:hypothetical protein